jgi:hypothetical protein
MVPQPTLPPQSEAIPVQIPILVPTTPPSPPITSTIVVAGGRRKKKEPIDPLPPRFQLPWALCEIPHSQMSFSSQAMNFYLASSRTPFAYHSTKDVPRYYGVINHTQTTYTNQFHMCHMCRIWALHSSFPIYPIRPPHISRRMPHISS